MYSMTIDSMTPRKVIDTVTPSHAQAQPRVAATRRDRFIPVRKTDLVAALLAHGALASESERSAFGRLCRLLALIYHNQFFGRLEQLREDYYYFSPECDPHARFDRAAQERAYADLVETLETVARDAEFIEVPRAEIEHAHREHPVLRVEVVTPTEDFREVRFFVRGRHTETFTVVEWLGLRRRAVEAEVCEDVVLFAAVRPDRGGEEERKHWARSTLRPGSVLLKHFRNVPTPDLNTLFPNVRVVMSLRDKLAIALPALVFAVPLGLKLITTLSMVFLVLGVYLGVRGTIDSDRLTIALAVLSGIVALGGFVTQQWLRYQSQMLKHQKALADTVYFRNINNNVGIFDYLVGTAEEQLTKDALLGYYFLHIADAPLAKAALEAKVKAWLKEAFGLSTRFDVEEALTTLDRLGVLIRDRELLSVPPIERALARLDQVWADFHRDAASKA